jgi:hypothetical protein
VDKHKKKSSGRKRNIRKVTTWESGIKFVDPRKGGFRDQRPTKTKFQPPSEMVHSINTKYSNIY